MSVPGGQGPSLCWVNQFALLPAEGGGTRHFELGRELVRRGWSVDIAASDFHLHKRAYSRRADGGDHREIVEPVDGVTMHWIWAAAYRHNDWRRAMNWLTFARSARALHRTLKRPDVVIGSSPQLFAASAGRSLARAFGVPFVFEVRDLWPESLEAAGSGRGLSYRVLARIADGLYRDADRILVLAQGTADYLAERGVPRDKLLYVPNGVDVHAVHPASHERTADMPFTVIYAGAHGAANGLDALLDAAERLGAASGVRFVLVGDGPAKQALRDDATRRGLTHVAFRDAVSKPQLVKMLGEADAGLMILREAPLFAFAVSPNKLFDYLAVALPVVCNVPGDVQRMVAESGGGEQARDSSGVALAEAIAAMRARSVAERRAMGHAGRSWVTREHSREVLGGRLDEQLRALLGR